MIQVDAAVGSWELQSLIQKQGITCEKATLHAADACFEGNGPDGVVGIGIERKKIQDMLNCIDDGRYAGHQAVKMRRMYRFNFLILEGLWRPDTRSGLLLEGHPKADGTVYWGADRLNRQRVMYRKLRRYLFSVSLSGVIVIPSRDIGQTAYDITELYHYFQKRWIDHKAMLAMHLGAFWQYDEASRNLMAVPTLAGRPSLTRRWAKELQGIGVKYSEDAARIFPSPIRLATSQEIDWMKIPGVGVETAKRIIREIEGRDR